ncbi:MAG: metallophosphoesterase, partial [Oscillospiraceae bacterium]|nr:metallophosphoesterase [Oscillospiraceae bacterium]
MKFSLCKENLNYVFITDIHYMGIRTGQGAVLLSQMEQAVELANNTDEIDLVVLGGDTVQGYWDDKRECFEAYREILSVLKDCKKPVLILNGNHDDNAYAAWNPNFSRKIISDL